ncbi:hypothetical protein QR680_003034 [Steinernema hermaphroditum]|uniref:Uncharacterized protein n=1 Tax=Steinernema hermaphroditum TaxID=289476 RepID=A0AA39H7B4_9BILA|nr:hypothetical protein QR680_003034 [Steinernema hermaphroditum]
MFTYNSTSEYESTANQKQMARELRGTIPHLQSDVAKLKQEIDAKERLLKEVLRDLGGIPPDERDRKLIDAVLHVTPGKFSDTAQADKRITLNQKWTLCFENMICVAAEINNNSDDSCDINSEVFTTNGSVTSYQTIFDGTSTISSIPGNCSRLVVIAFNKSAILHGNTSIVFDCYFSSPPSGSSDNFFLNELRPVTGNVIDRFQRLMLPVGKPTHRLKFSSLSDLFLSEIEQALQAVMAACPSKSITIMSEDDLVQKHEDIEKMSDFGSFKLITGKPDGLLTDMCIYVPPCKGSVLEDGKNCILFARNRDDLNTYEELFTSPASDSDRT